jgi:hypothetical protein
VFHGHQFGANEQNQETPENQEARYASGMGAAPAWLRKYLIGKIAKSLRYLVSREAPTDHTSHPTADVPQQSGKKTAREPNAIT